VEMGPPEALSPPVELPDRVLLRMVSVPFDSKRMAPPAARAAVVRPLRRVRPSSVTSPAEALTSKLREFSWASIIVLAYPLPAIVTGLPTVI
jgi:hypothetical protein